MSLIMSLLLATAQESAVPPAPPPCAPAPAPASGRIARLLASADGASAATAYRVRSVREEYQILAALGLCPGSQGLTTVGRRTYDVLTALDPRTGAERELWFDISAFFGR
jgi:hypothetical protein